MDDGFQRRPICDAKGDSGEIHSGLGGGLKKVEAIQPVACAVDTDGWVLWDTGDLLICQRHLWIGLCTSTLRMSFMKPNTGC